MRVRCGVRVIEGYGVAFVGACGGVRLGGGLEWAGLGGGCWCLVWVRVGLAVVTGTVLSRGMPTSGLVFSS